jgi:hypothetical protein
MISAGGGTTLYQGVLVARLQGNRNARDEIRRTTLREATFRGKDCSLTAALEVAGRSE